MQTTRGVAIVHQLLAKHVHFDPTCIKLVDQFRDPGNRSLLRPA